MPLSQFSQSPPVSYTPPHRDIVPLSSHSVGSSCGSLLSLDLGDDAVDLRAQDCLARDDLTELCVELCDVDDLARVLRLDVGADGEVVVLGGDVRARDDVDGMGDIRTLCIKPQDVLDVLRCEFVAVRDLDTFLRCVDKDGLRIRLGLFEYHDAGRDRRPEEEIFRQLDHGVDVVTVHKVLTDFLLCAAAVHDAREADNRCRAARCEPRKGVQDKGEVRLARRGEDARRCIARVIDEQRVVFPRPFFGVRRVGDNRLERLIVPVMRIDECVPMCNVEVVKVDVVQEHVDAAEVVRSDVLVLSVESVADVLPADDLGEFQQE